jgi:glycosyltransferase involved in cell wall biosynthesis
LKKKPAVPPDIKPLISAIIPTYNAARYLPEAIASIRSQNYAPLEILVVDDGSTDGTRQLARGWPDVRYVYQENQGVSAARNTGIALARGELLAFLDADDLWTPNHLQLLIKPLLEQPELRYVWGLPRIVRLHERGDGSRTVELLEEQLPAFLVGSGLFRPAVFDEVGRFDPALRLSEDLDWWLASRQKRVPMLQIPEVLLIYRKRAGSLTHGKTVSELNIGAAVIRSIHRHRASKTKTSSPSTPSRKAA